MAAVAVPPGAPMFARRNDEGHYTWQGVRYPSVTTVLGMTKSEHLLTWYGKMAALECAEAVARRDRGEMTAEACDAYVLDWQSRMSAAIRYRDYKGAIGSLVHHTVYERALATAPMPQREADWVDYLRHHAYALGLVDREREDEHNPYSAQLARDARPYVGSALEWIEDERPDFNTTGHEAVVVSRTHGYAGTTDFIARLPKRGNKVAQGDWKTSKSIDEQKFRMQVEAYRRGDFIGLVADGSEQEIPPSELVVIVHVLPGPAAKTHVFEPSDEAFQAFLDLRGFYGYLNGMPRPRPTAAKRATSLRDKECPI